MSTDQDGESLWPPRQAGKEVLALVEDNEFLHFMSMENLSQKGRIGESSISDSRTVFSYHLPGYYAPLRNDQHSVWSETLAFRTETHIAGLLPPSTRVLRCRSLILKSEDQAIIGKFIIYQLTRDKSQKKYVGRIDEILVELERERLVGLLVSKCQIKEDIPPYRFPACVVQDKRELLAFEVRTDKMYKVNEDIVLTVDQW